MQRQQKPGERVTCLLTASSPVVARCSMGNSLPDFPVSVVPEASGVGGKAGESS